MKTKTPLPPSSHHGWGLQTVGIWVVYFPENSIITPSVLYLHRFLSLSYSNLLSCSLFLSLSTIHFTSVIDRVVKDEDASHYLRRTGRLL